MNVAAQWWGYSKEHGWVILDREIPCNTPGLTGELLFFRCRDASIFFLKRELWGLPAYQFAPNFVRSLGGSSGLDADAELAELMRRWPEFQISIRGQYGEIVERENAERREAAKRQKKEAAEQRKKRPTIEDLKAGDPVGTEC